MVTTDIFMWIFSKICNIVFNQTIRAVLIQNFAKIQPKICENDGDRDAKYWEWLKNNTPRKIVEIPKIRYYVMEGENTILKIQSINN